MNFAQVVINAVIYLLACVVLVSRNSWLKIGQTIGEVVYL